MGDKKKKGKGKLSGRTKLMLAVFVVVILGLVGFYTARTGVLPFEGGSFKHFISFKWVTGK